MPLLDILTRKENNPNSNTVAPKIISLEHQVYGLSVREKLTLVGSFIKGSNDNYIQLVQTGFKFPHRLPPSKVAWNPSRNDPDTFASTSTSLRIWKVTEDKPVVKLYPTSKNGASSPCPITSFSWNSHNTTKIATSSIDTTISVWDVEKAKVDTQLIAHEKSVLDVAYGNSMHQFVSVSEDGSLRLFDTRDLDHSTILYEDSAPLLRVTWSAPNLIATMAADSSDIMLFDTRKSGFLVGVVRLGPACPNAMAWSNSGTLAVGLSDGSIAVSGSLPEILSSQSSGQAQKLKPDKVIPPLVTGGVLTNIAWSDNELTVAYGSQLCMDVDFN